MATTENVDEINDIWLYRRLYFLWPTPTGEYCEDSDERRSYVVRNLYQTLPLPMERRPLPANILESLTPREKQFRRRLEYRVEHRSAMGPLAVCKGWPVNTWEYIQIPYSPHYPWLDDGTEPNWALALRNKIQDDKVSFADTIGEWRESVQLLEGAANLVQKAYRHAKALWRFRKNRRALARYFRRDFGRDPRDKFELFDIVQTDLLIKFGLKPTCDLVWDSLEALDIVKKAARRIQVTVPIEERYSYPGASSGQLDVVRTRSYRAVAYVHYDVEDTNFTSGNIAEALWAGTRASFIIDWFYDVGSYLKAFNAMNGVRSLKGTLTKRETIRATDRRVDNVTYSLKSPGKWIEIRNEREVFTTIPLPDLPGFRIPETDLWSRLHTCIEILASTRRAAARL